MTGFLNRLADIALGSPMPGAAHLSLPPRFAPLQTSEQGPLDIDRLLEVDATAPAEWPQHKATPQPVAPRAQSNAHVEELIVAPALENPAPASNTVAAPLPVPRPKTAVDAVPPTTADAPISLNRQQKVQASLGPQRESNAPPVLEKSEPPQTERGTVRPAADIARPLVQPVTTSPLGRSATRNAPLSERAVAGRMSQAREDRIPVHVTIDRIDVRMPASAKPDKVPSRPRPVPTVSLSSYLKGRNGPGGGA